MKSDKNQFPNKTSIKTDHEKLAGPRLRALIPEPWWNPFSTAPSLPSVLVPPEPPDSYIQSRIQPKKIYSHSIFGQVIEHEKKPELVLRTFIHLNEGASKDVVAKDIEEILNQLGPQGVISALIRAVNQQTLDTSSSGKKEPLPISWSRVLLGFDFISGPLVHLSGVSEKQISLALMRALNKSLPPGQDKAPPLKEIVDEISRNPSAYEDAIKRAIPDLARVFASDLVAFRDHFSSPIQPQNEVIADLEKGVLKVVRKGPLSPFHSIFWDVYNEYKKQKNPNWTPVDPKTPTEIPVRERVAEILKELGSPLRLNPNIAGQIPLGYLQSDNLFSPGPPVTLDPDGNIVDWAEAVSTARGGSTTTTSRSTSGTSHGVARGSAIGGGGGGAGGPLGQARGSSLNLGEARGAGNVLRLGEARGGPAEIEGAGAIGGVTGDKLKGGPAEHRDIKDLLLQAAGLLTGGYGAYKLLRALFSGRDKKEKESVWPGLLMSLLGASLLFHPYLFASTAPNQPSAPKK